MHYIIAIIVYELKKKIQGDVAMKNNKDDNTVADNIRNLREINILTQAEFAEKLGVAPQTVSKWENGNTLPQHSKMVEIAKIFNVEVSQLYTGYVAKNYTNDKNMDQIIEFMNQINHKMDYVLSVNGITDRYLRACQQKELDKLKEEKDETKYVFKSCSETEEEFEARMLKEAEEAEYAELLYQHDYDSVFELCDKMIMNGDARGAEWAMQASVEMYGDYVFAMQDSTTYVKIYIHHLMEICGLTKDDLL